MLDVPTLLAKLCAVGLECFSLAERPSADCQAEQVSRARHRHIHSKQVVGSSLSRPSPTVAVLPGSPWQQTRDEVLVVERFKHKRRSVGLSLDRMNRAEFDVHHAIFLSASECIHCMLYSPFLHNLYAFRYPSKVLLGCLGLLMRSSENGCQIGEAACVG
ncbi:hypothetical protein D3C77_570030 [compost metagenome]